MMWKHSFSNALQTGLRKHTTLDEGKEKLNGERQVLQITRQKLLWSENIP